MMYTTLTWLTLTSVIIANLTLILILPCVIIMFIRHRELISIYSSTIVAYLIILTLYIILASVYHPTSYFDVILSWGIAEPTTTIETIFFLIILNLDYLNLITSCVIVTASNFFDTIEYRTLTSTTSHQECAFIIVCHNSSDRIQNTISAILKTSTPDNCIYIADNGSTHTEIQATKDICNLMHVNYCEIEIGNKTVAQFMVANLIKTQNKCVKYIVCLDDDTLISPDWDIQHVATHFNDDVCAVAFPLIANTQSCFISSAQTFEYLISMISKTAQSRIETTIFASGGFSMYDLDKFIEIIAHHTTEFHGEDFQLGLIAHSLYNKKALTKSHYHNKHFTVGACTRYAAKTITPSHWIHLTKSCKCGEKSLFAQRVFSWDMTRYKFVSKFIKVVFSKSTWLVKFLMLWELMLILSDFVAVAYIAYFGCYLSRWQSIFQTFIISCVWTTPFLCILNLTLLRKYDVPMFVVMVYSPAYKLIMNTIIKYCAIFISIKNMIIPQQYDTILNRMQNYKFVSSVSKFILKPTPIHV